MSDWRKRRLRRAEQQRQQAACAKVLQALGRWTDQAAAALFFGDEAGGVAHLERLGINNRLLALALDWHESIPVDEVQERLSELVRPYTTRRAASIREHLSDEALAKAKEKYE